MPFITRNKYGISKTDWKCSRVSLSIYIYHWKHTSMWFLTTFDRFSVKDRYLLYIVFLFKTLCHWITQEGLVDQSYQKPRPSPNHIAASHLLVAKPLLETILTHYMNVTDFIGDQSTLFQVMAWCRQATSHYLSQCWPRSLSPYGVKMG